MVSLYESTYELEKQFDNIYFNRIIKKNHYIGNAIGAFNLQWNN